MHVVGPPELSIGVALATTAPMAAGWLPTAGVGPRLDDAAGVAR